MKDLLFKIILLWIVNIFVSSCVVEPNIDTTNKKYINKQDYINISSNITLTKGGGDDKNILNRAERLIKTVRLYAFDDNVLDTTILYYVNALDSCIIKAQLKKSNNKNLFILINEPEIAYYNYIPDIDTANIRHRLQYSPEVINIPELGELLDTNSMHNIAYNLLDFIQYPVKELLDSSYCLPAFGALRNIDLQKDETKNLSIPTDRAVARIDFYLQKDNAFLQEVSINEKTVLQIPKSVTSGYVSPSFSNIKMQEKFYSFSVDLNHDRIIGDYVLRIDTTTLNKTTAFNIFGTRGPIGGLNIPNKDNGYVRTFSCYVPEFISEDDSEKLEFTLKNVFFGKEYTKDYNLVIDKSLLTQDGKTNKFKRNYVYKIYCTISDINPMVDIRFEIVDWNKNNIINYISL